MVHLEMSCGHARAMDQYSSDRRSRSPSGPKSIREGQGPPAAMDAGNHDAAALVQTFTCQPSEEQLSQGLKQFKPWSSSPTQSSASVIFTLVNITIPELWRSLASTTTSKKTVRLLTECLSSVSGVNALLLRLDSLHAQALKSSSRDEQNQLQDVLQVLSLILEGDKFCPAEVIGLCRADNSRGKLLFNEYVTLVGGSRILNVVSKVASSVDHGESYWIAEGKAYSRWLGKRIGEATYLSSDGPEVDVLLGKSLSLGYPCNPSNCVNNYRFGYRRTNAAVHTRRIDIKTAILEPRSKSFTRHQTTPFHQTTTAVPRTYLL